MTIPRSARKPASRWWLAFFGVACALAHSVAAQAETLSLGSMTLYKAKGQPTYAEIAVNGATQGDAARLRARVASPEAYRAAGLRYAPTLSQIAVSPRQSPDGRVGLRLDIPDAAADGSLDLLLLVGDAVSVAMAEYRLDFTGTARVFPALEAGTALIPTAPQVAKAPTIAAPPAKASAAASVPAASRPVPPVAAAKPASAAAVVATTPAASTAAGVDNAAAGQAAAALAAWADAWSRRDVDAYVGMYVPDFTGRTKPPSHDAWVAERRARIESKHGIEVRVSSLSAIPRAGLMVLTFTQTYAGDGLKQTSRKRLALRHVADRWLIQEETELP